MKTIIKIELIVAVVLLFAFSLPSFSRHEINMDTEIQLMLIKQTPQPNAKAFAYSVFRTAPLEVAKVFGRTPGCSDADAEMIQATARAAVEADLDPAIAAATVGVESACNQFAVSSKGAIGIMQIMPKVWKDKYDFAGDVNLFNRDTNLSVGAHIEADLINQYGTENGVRRYNGMGVGCDTCDAGYTSKILTLAGRR
jgi:hypothetical protein